MSGLPDREQLRVTLAKVIAETCRCDAAALLRDDPFTTVIENFDSLYMLEIMLGIEVEYGLSADDLLPRDYTTSEELAEFFPINLTELAEHIEKVAARKAADEAAGIHPPTPESVEAELRRQIEVEERGNADPQADAELSRALPLTPIEPGRVQAAPEQTHHGERT